mmetsp:Transcript_11301/g.33565  ORF Transcript_11301/g.33565 Transcript_11301/m.33565 type:complete len:245 (-) Transcript_11301:2708-3442(-)
MGRSGRATRRHLGMQVREGGTEPVHLERLCHQWLLRAQRGHRSLEIGDRRGELPVVGAFGGADAPGRRRRQRRTRRGALNLPQPHLQDAQPHLHVARAAARLSSLTRQNRRHVLQRAARQRRAARRRRGPNRREDLHLRLERSHTGLDARATRAAAPTHVACWRRLGLELLATRRYSAAACTCAVVGCWGCLLEHRRPQRSHASSQRLHLIALGSGTQSLADVPLQALRVSDLPCHQLRDDSLV